MALEFRKSNFKVLEETERGNRTNRLAARQADKKEKVAARQTDRQMQKDKLTGR